jgi:hypothetical protein
MAAFCFAPRSRFFEIAFVFVRFDHVASRIVNANHSIVRATVEISRNWLDSEGRTIWIADAHRDDGQRFVVRADERLTAFLELQAAIHRRFE